MKQNRRAAAGLALAACIALPAAQSAAGLPGLPTTALILDVNAHPAFDWSVPSRYDASWAAWHTATDTYDRAFVNPLHWSVNLNVCGSTSLYKVTGYTIALEQLGTTWKRTYNTTACTLNLHNILPAQGYYAATVTLNTQIGLNAGVSAPLRRTLAIKDHLIVSMGDSFASGEGNPDVPGAYDVTYNPITGKESSVHTRTPAQWKDENCHRSARSGPALAAKAFEDADPKTSVTFVSVACTGAELLNLTDFAYKGVPPQADTVAAALKSHDGIPARTIDALLVTAGVNDLHFSDIIERCASNWGNSPSCVTQGGIADQLQQLPSKLLAVVTGLHAKLPNTREVYLSAYPDDPFHGGGCDALGNSLTGIDSAEAETMHTYGIGLNRAIATMAGSFRTSPWNVNSLDLTAVPFYAHAYCASTPWFVRYEQSWSTQGDKLGTAHPNALGSQAYASQIRKLVVLDQASTPYRHLTVTVNAIKLPAKSGAPTRAVSEYLSEYQNDPTGLTRYVSVPQNGAWTAVPAAQRTFKLDVYRSPSSPRHATGLYMSIDHMMPITATLSNAYNVGRHIVTHPAGLIALDYTVTVATS